MEDNRDNKPEKLDKKDHAAMDAGANAAKNVVLVGFAGLFLFLAGKARDLIGSIFGGKKDS